MAHETDVVIIGGGLVGASLALALEPLELSIDVLESIPFNHDAQPSFDERTIALTFGSRRVFEAIGIWAVINGVGSSVGFVAGVIAFENLCLRN